MRVLHIITACPYGKEEGEFLTPWLWNLLKELHNLGVKVDLFCPTYLGKRGDKFLCFDVHRFRYAPAPFERLGYRTAIPELLKRDKRFYALIPPLIILGFINACLLSEERKFDIVHVHWPFPLAIFSLPFKIRGTPVVHSYYTAEIKLLYSLGASRHILNLLSRTANVKTAISTYVKSLLKDEDVEVVPYASAINLPEFYPPRKRAENPVILFVGRLVERKGVEYLIRSMEFLKKGGVKLRIVGDGPLRERLVSMVKRLNLDKNVEFLGKVSSEQLVEEYKKAHIFILPSIVDSRGDTEGLGVVLIEALTFGLPVVASNVGGIPDIVINNRTGILVPPKDPHAIASAVEYLLSNWDRAKEMVIMGQEHIRRNFMVKTAARRLLRIYKELIGEGV